MKTRNHEKIRDRYGEITPRQLIEYALNHPDDGKGIGKLFYSAHTEDDVEAALSLASLHNLLRHPIFRELSDMYI